MTDSSNFRDVVEEITTDSTVEESSTQAQPVTENVTPEEPEKIETFADEPDVKELESMTPQQLLEVKRNWEKAYTQKRQSETKQLKEYQAKLSEMEARLNQGPTQTQVSVDQRANQATEQVQLGKMSIDEYTQYMQSLMAEKAREVAREEYKTIASQQREESLAQSSLEQFSSVDSRLNEHSPEFNQSFRSEVQREVADVLDQHLEEHGSYEGFDAAAITKQIVQRRDQEIDEIIKQRTQQSTQAARMREAKSRKSEVRGTTSQSQQVGGDSIRDVLMEAIEG